MYSGSVHVCLHSYKVSSNYLEQFWSYRAYTKICEKMQREITWKVSKLELCHLCAACLIIWIYIPIKVHPNTLNRFGVMEYTQKFVKKYQKFCFVWFNSLRPINSLSVIKGPVFLGWTSTKLGLMFLLKDTTQWRWWGSNPRPFGLKSSTLPLSHCAPVKFFFLCVLTRSELLKYNL